MRRILLSFVVAILGLVVLWTSAWGTLALWFRMPGPEILRLLVAAAFGTFGLATLIRLFGPLRWRWLAVFAGLTAVLLVWWNTLVPPSEGDWALGLERQVTGTIDGDTLTLTDVRDFVWETTTEAEVAWTTQSYDLSTITSVDLFMSYWAGPTMAHMMVSFGFEDGRFLSWSNEVRREKDSSFSPVADFFKEHAIAVVAAEERDVIGMRSNVWGDTVYIFRMGTTPERAREMLEAYVAAANHVAKQPEWFNSIFTNCSRTVIQMARAIGVNLPLDWRVLVNGYFPDYLYELGGLNTSFTLEELYAAGDITPRALDAGLTPAFSTAIREGVPPGR